VLDFGTVRPVEQLKLYFLDDGAGVRPPSRYAVEIWNGSAWVPAPAASRSPLRPAGRRPNVVSFARPVETSRVRVTFTHRAGSRTGLTELEAWARVELPLPEPATPTTNVAYNGAGRGFPSASASFTGARDRVEEVNDMRIAFTRYSRNRWTAHGSPNPSDWVQLDFGEPRTVRAVELYLWGDGGGVRAPRRYAVQYWDGRRWAAARVRSRTPDRPAASAVNTVRIDAVRTQKVRVILEHDLPSASGISELIVWGEAPEERR
jgi:hypothetical protein